MHIPNVFVARFLVALVATFGSASIETPQETAKSVAQVTAAPLEISTSKGPATITAVELSDRVPPKWQTITLLKSGSRTTVNTLHTSSSEDYLVAKKGYKYLIVWLAPKPNTKSNFWQQRGAYVVDGQGVRFEQAAALGYGQREKGEKEYRYFYLVAFSGVTSASKEFTFFWPDNPGIGLPKPTEPTETTPAPKDISTDSSEDLTDVEATLRNTLTPPPKTIFVKSPNGQCYAFATTIVKGVAGRTVTLRKG